VKFIKLDTLNRRTNSATVRARVSCWGLIGLYKIHT